MSLAVTTITALTIIDGASLKRHSTAYDFQRSPAPATLKAHAWSTDNSILYLASSDTIYTFSPTLSAFTALYNTPQGSPLQPVLVSRDKSTLIFAQGPAIHLLAVGSSSPKITSTLIGHSAPVTSLSLCSDASMLASSSTSGTICVHNLAHNSLTVLKGCPGLPGPPSKTLVCAFHPHTRTRLLVGCGKNLVVYDTTRASSPVKTIPLLDKDSTCSIPNIGHVVAISCSPFSKTLTAVAFSSGFIALVDLEKDRPFFKNLQLKAPVTSMTFTADGSSVAAGTENGKVIVQDLRAMEHEHRTLAMGDEGKGERVIALSIQRRIRHTTPISAAAPKSATGTAKLPTSASAPLTQYDLNNAIIKSPARRVVSTSPGRNARKSPVTPLKSRPTKEVPPRRAFSPPKVAVTCDTSVDISIQIDTLVGTGGTGEARNKTSRQGTETEKGTALKPRLSGSRTILSSLSSVASTTDNRNRPMTGTTSSERPSSKSTVTSRSGLVSTPAIQTVSSLGGTKPTVSSTRSSPNNFLKPNKELPTNTVSTSEHTLDSGSIDLTSQSSSKQLAYPEQGDRRTSGAHTDRTSRSPTPDLPPVDRDTPQSWMDRLKNPNTAINAAGTLSTPDMERWVEAGQGKPSFPHPSNFGTKHVGWADSSGDSNLLEGEDKVLDSDNNEPTISAITYDNKAAVDFRQVPPLSENTSMSPIRRAHIHSNALQLSPLRSPSKGVTGGNGNGGAQELLRAVVNDVMYEYRRETKEDIKGLHLDLLRMGRSWKSELRTMMDEYIGDMRDMREENARLRKENERLRRGY